MRLLDIKKRGCGGAYKLNKHIENKHVIIRVLSLAMMSLTNIQTGNKTYIMGSLCVGGYGMKFSDSII